MSDGYVRWDDLSPEQQDFAAAAERKEADRLDHDRKIARRHALAGALCEFAMPTTPRKGVADPAIGDVATDDG